MSMKIRKLALVLVIVLLASTLAPALAKSPFADVPADHWAYDSIVELAAAGLIEGYPDGTYGGARMMTRYEAAMVFARALARLESRVDILPELDRVKAELAEELKGQLAPVETKVVEKVIIDRDVNDEALARIRATEIAAEALEGDIAYVEHRVLGLVDGIRYDINQLQEQVDGLEVPSSEEIEALIAAKIEAALLEGAQDVVHETTVIERVVVTDPELTEEDVDLIAQELITQRLQQYSRFIMESFAADIEELNKRIDALEAAQADLANKEELAAVEADVAAVKEDVGAVKLDVDAVKEDVDAVKADVKDLQKVKIGGTLSLGGKYYLPAGEVDKVYGFNSDATLNLSIKASDTVNVKANFTTNNFASLTGGKVAVTSQGPIKSLTVGKWAGGPDVVGIGHPYVLGNSAYSLAGLADLDLIDGLTAKALLGMDDKTDPVVAGLAFDYKFIDELGVKVAVAGEKAPTVMPEAKAVGAGIFGKVGGVTYGGNFAMDLESEVPEGEAKENTIFDVNLAFDVGPLKLDGKYINRDENYRVTNPLIEVAKEKAGNSIEVGAETDFLLGIDLGARYYRETEAEAEDAAISAYTLTAAKDFDLVVPVSVSAGYVSNKQGEEDEDQKTQFSAGLAVGPEAPERGLRWGAGLDYVKGEYNQWGNWKNGNISDRNVATIKGDVGYKFDWRGATLDLGYGAKFRMPVLVKEDPEENVVGPNVLTHNLSVGYNFTKDVKLTLGGKIVQTLDDPVDNDFTYNAGLTISF